jgi:molecular chaperone HtpG
VLLLTDPADEYVLSAIGTFRNKSIISIDAADLKLPAATTSEQTADKPADTESQAAVPEGFDRLIEVLKEALGDQVQDVRRSDRLTDSICCLVNAEGSMSTTMQRILRMNAPDFEMRRMILEVNPSSPLVKRLAELSGNPGNNDFIRDCGLQLHANAMIQAGLAPNGNEMAARLQNFMLQLAAARP